MECCKVLHISTRGGGEEQCIGKLALQKMAQRVALCSPFSRPPSLTLCALPCSHSQRDLDASRLEVVHLTAAVKRLEGELEVRSAVAAVAGRRRPGFSWEVFSSLAD